MSNILRLGLVGLVALIADIGTCATIDRGEVNSDLTAIFISDDIEAGDDATFVSKVLDLSKGLVVLKSNGGNLNAAIQIGEAIRLKDLATAVLDGDTCASACALAWLAGNPRYLGRSAHIGFHAAYEFSEGVAQERGAPNAIIGAYLSGLGLSREAILYVTNTPPEGMQWLSPEDASRLGIEVRLPPKSDGYAAVESDDRQGFPAEPTVVACSFRGQQQMILTFRGGMGARDNTLQIGQTPPVPLSVGSGLSIAEADGKEYVFSLRAPASVTIDNGATYMGSCVSTLQR